MPPSCKHFRKLNGSNGSEIEFLHDVSVTVFRKLCRSNLDNFKEK